MMQMCEIRPTMKVIKTGSGTWYWALCINDEPTGMLLADGLCDTKKEAKSEVRCALHVLKRDMMKRPKLVDRDEE